MLALVSLSLTHCPPGQVCDGFSVRKTSHGIFLVTTHITFVCAHINHLAAQQATSLTIVVAAAAAAFVVVKAQVVCITAGYPARLAESETASQIHSTIAVNKSLSEHCKPLSQ
jgi:hypothetical protein